jgi:hypothetical protein
MSERMIELQRARLLAVKGSKSGASQITSTQQIPQTTSSARSEVSGRPASAAKGTSTQQLAAASALSDDADMSLFFEMLQKHRDDNRADVLSGPTVPTALSRRILQREGVGYLDSTVAVLASAMADRFLATLIHQSVVCRDHRLKGCEFARETEKYRRRHQRLHRDSVQNRWKRKLANQQKREMSNLAIVQVAENVKAKGSLSKESSKDGDVTIKSKKKKKATSAGDQQLGVSNTNSNAQTRENDSDDALSFDSIDEEEDYYGRYYSETRITDSGTDDEEDEMIILRDFERSLEAWNFSVAGKSGVDPTSDHVFQRQGVGNQVDDDDDTSYNMNEFERSELNSSADLGAGVSISVAVNPSEENRSVTPIKTEASPLLSSSRPANTVSNR